MKQKRTKETPEKEDTDEETSSFFTYIKHIKTVKTRNVLIPVQIEDVEVRIEPNSSVDANIMDAHQFKALKNISSEMLRLEPSRTKLTTLQSELPVKRAVKVHISNETRSPLKQKSLF